MNRRQFSVIPIVAMLVIAGAAVTTSNVGASEAYGGTYVSFGTEANAITDYSVDGEPILGTVKVQSANEAEGSGLIDARASLSAVTSLDGAALTLSATTSTSATVDAEGSASMDAHDTEHGILVVRAGDEEQYVKADLSDDADAQAASDGRVTVTAADGVEGTFVVVGDGEATVNDEGDVVAKLGEDGQLVFRAYPDGKSDGDRAEERLITNGTAAGEVHVMSEGEETVTDTVVYDSETAITAEQTAENRVNVTVDRVAHDGKVIITTISESALEAADGLSVTVDGEAAVQANSHSELQEAIGSDRSKYLVRQSSDAQESAEVLVAVNHFSERTITMTDADDEPPTDDRGATEQAGSGDTTTESTAAGNDDGASTPGQPGFGVSVAIVALLAAVLVGRVRRG